MQALVWHGAHDVRLDRVADPTLQEPDDILLKVSSTAICGSDLHLYRGKVPGMESGDILGHEFMGVVEEVGPAVRQLRRGDRVVVPFTIACGECLFCDLDLYAACENTNPGEGLLADGKRMRPAAGMFGYSKHYGGYAGGQAEWVRVPKANTGPIRIPEGIEDERVLFLSDILPTGYQAALNANIVPGCSVAIFGAGPVGCMAAACARMLGAERLFMIDHHDYRLRFARERYQAETLNFDEIDDPAEWLIERTTGRGVDASIDALGFEAKGSALDTMMTTLKIEGSSGRALHQAIAATRRGGAVSVPGVYAGFIHGFMFGDLFEKGLTIRAGQTHVQHYLPTLLKAVNEGLLAPHEIITHRLALADAVRGYEIFDRKLEECRKVILRT